MIHPHTRLKWKNDTVGYGVFATAFIPKGTIIYLVDALEIVLPPGHPLTQNPSYAEYINKYAYLDGAGNQIISWDIAKYVNHCCQANTLSTAYGFEIAIQDIQPDEEITDEYALFSAGLTFPLICDRAGCRLCLRPTDLQEYGRSWDAKIQNALCSLPDVSQPLQQFLPPGTLDEVLEYLRSGIGYRSVQTLTFAPTDQPQAAGTL